MRSFLILVCFNFSLIYAQEIKKDVFGFATSNTFTYCDINDTFFVNKVVELSPKILRFPGGAVGNFYHFGKLGYGFDFAEIDKYHDGKFPKRSRGLERSRIKKNQDYDYIRDFILLAKKTNAKVVLVANLFSNNNDIILMIEEMLRNNIQIVGVELGSELSNRSYYNNGYTIEKYIVSSKKCSDKIKKKYPNIKTAIVAAPLGKHKGHRHNIWNEKLSKLDFYDAIIIHSYAKVIKGKDQYGKMITEVNEFDNKIDLFENFKNRIIEYLTITFPKEIQDYNNIFSKPIWITEWNLQMSKTTGNTLFQSLFVANFLLEIMSNNKTNTIDVLTYHNLGGRDFSGSIFRNENDILNIQSAYYPLRFLGEVFNYNISKITKKQKNRAFSYSFFDKNKMLKLRYNIDWDKNLFQYINYDDFSNPDTNNLHSLQLYDSPDRFGNFETTKND